MKLEQSLSLFLKPATPAILLQWSAKFQGNLNLAAVLLKRGYIGYKSSNYQVISLATLLLV